MQTKLQELTEKIYQEGVIKAKEEADKILADAEKEAGSIVSSAQKKADALLEDARKKADEFNKNSMNELQLSARQLFSDARQKVINLIESQVIEPNVKSSVDDLEFTREIIKTLVANWNPKGDETVDISVLLPVEKQKEFEEFFKGKVGEKLGKGVEVSFSDKFKGGFKVGPKEGGYLISFTDDDFDNLFRGYLRPRLVELFFKTE